MIILTRLKELLDYHPDTGVFIWKVNKQRVAAGDQAGVVMNSGYIRIKLDRRGYLAHRLAWFYANGIWPENDVDHINGDRTDNRLSNLRLASRSENCRNATAKAHSATGAKGVDFHKSMGKYRARLRVPAGRIMLGFFDTVEEAAAAYETAALQHHGQFAGHLSR